MCQVSIRKIRLSEFFGSYCANFAIDNYTLRDFFNSRLISKNVKSPIVDENCLFFISASFGNSLLTSLQEKKEKNGKNKFDLLSSLDHFLQFFSNLKKVCTYIEVVFLKSFKKHIYSYIVIHYVGSTEVSKGHCWEVGKGKKLLSQILLPQTSSKPEYRICPVQNCYVGVIYNFKGRIYVTFHTIVKRPQKVSLDT